MGHAIQEELEANGIFVRYQLWTSPHILEIRMHTLNDYEKAYEYMRLECPTEVASLCGVDESRLLLFQFDGV
ncbi:MAG TPA: hypothetical protein VMW50_10025 [Dehalococcoidia bacterium]|nr:hypothetical protein [Dehalococcoidia bacterium]